MQEPTAPFDGGVAALHGFGLQTVSVVVEQAVAMNFPTPQTVQVEEHDVTTAVAVSYFPASHVLQTRSVVVVQTVKINLPAPHSEFEQAVHDAAFEVVLKVDPDTQLVHTVSTVVVHGGL